MKKQREEILISIEDLIHQKEKELEHQLPAEEIDFLLDTCTDFVLDNIHKYISGSKEHFDDGSFLESVNHIDEIYKEGLDLINYSSALKYKLRNRKK